MASSGYFDEDQMANLKEEVGPLRVNVSTNCVQRGRIGTVQSSFSESDAHNFCGDFSIN